jgi:hypothetical protein
MFFVILIQISINTRFGLSCWLVYLSTKSKQELNAVLWMLTHISMKHSTVK